MPSATVNIPSAASSTPIPTLVTKLTRGLPAKLGTLTALSQAVAFTVPEPTRDNQGFLIIQVSTGTAGTTAVLEASIDGAATWFTLTLTALGNTVIGGDTAAVAGYQVSIAGFGSGTQFRFGYITGAPTNAVVWALVG